MEELELLEREIEIEEQLLIIECKESFYSFLKAFWDIIIPEEPIYNWHIKYLCDELQKVAINVKDRKPKLYDVIINIPPGSSKSTIVTIMYPVWCWVIDPSMRFVSASHDIELATEHSVKSRDIIKSDRFRRYFGDIQIKSDQDNKRHYQNNTSGGRVVASVGSNITGKHGHLIIVDDPVNPESALSDIKREKANRWMGATLATRKIDKANTPTILVMQRLHEDDPTGHITSKKKNILHICLPAEESKLVKPPELKQFYINGLLDPVRMPKEVLNEMKVDLGSYSYANQFEQSGAPLDGGIFKKSWFNVITWNRFNEITKGANIIWNMKIDGAYTENTLNDPCGMWSSTFYNNKIYVRNFHTDWYEQPEFIKKLIEWMPEQGYTNRSKTKIEPKANGLSTVQTLQRETKLNVMSYRFPKGGKVSMTDSKFTRASACSPSCESGRVVFIDGAYVELALNQLASYPNGAHDEVIDCLVMDVAENFLAKPPRTLSRSMSR